MLDIFNIPGQQDNVKTFYTAGTTAWQTWNKPRNCKFIWMMCVGGGAGGAGGLGFTAGAGPAGGGSGGIVRSLFPANVLPDTLYIQPGPGGAGGIGQATGVFGSSGAGNKSFVSITPSSAITMNIVCTSGNAAAASAGGAAVGAAETIATVTNAGLLSLGNFTAIAGQAGAWSGIGAASITPLVSTVTCGGAQGSYGDTTTGGSINATSISPLISPGIGNTAKLNGDNGILSQKPFFGLGGARGGGGNLGGNGGKGGDGAYGCGGGGGGSSGTGTGGNGGKGGDGLVIIATF